MIITLSLYWLLRSTELGRQVRAPRPIASRALMGINVNRVNLLAFGIGVGCLGIAGPVIMPIFYVVPNIGSFFILIAFVVVVLGGIGNFMGAVRELHRRDHGSLAPSSCRARPRRCCRSCSSFSCSVQARRAVPNRAQ